MPDEILKSLKISIASWEDKSLAVMLNLTVLEVRLLKRIIYRAGNDGLDPSGENNYMVNQVKANAEKIGESKIFVAFVSQNWIESPYCAMQLGIAILLNKPIRLMVPEGLNIPTNLKLLAEKIGVFKGPDDVGIVAEKLLGDLK